MTPNFRHLARESLARARAELASEASSRLKFAALELRMAIESVTYERAQSYKDEIPPSEYRTWQPKKLMQVLVDIEPNADKGVSIAFGIEEVPGVEAKEMTWLGAESVFDLKAIKAHYDALGSYLHMPTLKQLEESGEPDLSKLRSRCDAIIALLDKVLTSPVFNINFGTFSAIKCANSDCGQTIRKRVPAGATALSATCQACGMSYEVSAGPGDQCTWRPILEDVQCPGAGCSQVFKVSPSELQPGRRLACNVCGGRFQIGLGLFAADKSVTSADEVERRA
jgi:hypothetical protein